MAGENMLTTLCKDALCSVAACCRAAWCSNQLCEASTVNPTSSRMQNKRMAGWGRQLVRDNWFEILVR